MLYSGLQPGENADPPGPNGFSRKAGRSLNRESSGLAGFYYCRVDYKLLPYFGLKPARWQGPFLNDTAGSFGPG